MIGEETGKGSCSGKATTALPSPSPTIELGAVVPRDGDRGALDPTLPTNRETRGFNGAVAIEVEGQRL